MALVVLVAISVSALRNASELWAGILLLATLATLGTAILGVVYRREGKRAFALGFALFAAGYLVLAMGPWFSEQFAPKLPTTQLLDYLHGQVVGTPVALKLTGNVMLSGGSTTLSADQLLLTWVNANGATKQAATSSYIKRFIGMAAPGAANYEPFLWVGHCLFALLAGLMGGLVARRFQRTCPAT
jgi:hypothetical protein